MWRTAVYNPVRLVNLSPVGLTLSLGLDAFLNTLPTTTSTLHNSTISLYIYFTFLFCDYFPPFRVIGISLDNNFGVVLFIYLFFCWDQVKTFLNRWTSDRRPSSPPRQSGKKKRSDHSTGLEPVLYLLGFLLLFSLSVYWPPSVEWASRVLLDWSDSLAKTLDSRQRVSLKASLGHLNKTRFSRNWCAVM